MKLLLLFATLMVISQTYVSARTLSCYYSNWNNGRANQQWRLRPNQINPRLCTHLIYAFASLDGNNFNAVSSLPQFDIQDGYYDEFTRLKQNNNDLKTLLAVGGWADSNDGTDKWSQLVSSQANIDTFVQSLARLVRTHNFDGVDIDWEYPKTQADRDGLVSLLRTLRERADLFPNRQLVLTAAVSPAPSTVDAGYDTQAIDQYVDFINLMTYDLRGTWDANGTVADHHAPLQRRSFDATDDTRNVEDSVKYWRDTKGFNASKILVGIPAYGRSWRLSSDQTAPPAPAQGAGDMGPVTQEPGVLAYFEICQDIRNNNWILEANAVGGSYAVSPAGSSIRQWVGFEEVNSAIRKSNWIIEQNLGGAMIWDLALDDFRNICAGGNSPLVTAVHNIVNPI